MIYSVIRTRTYSFKLLCDLCKFQDPVVRLKASPCHLRPRARPSSHPRIFKAATTQNEAQVNGRNSVCDVITKLSPLYLPKSAPLPRALPSSSDSRETQQKCSDARSTAWPAIEAVSKIERGVRFILLRCIEVMLVCR